MLPNSEQREIINAMKEPLAPGAWTRSPAWVAALAAAALWGFGLTHRLVPDEYQADAHASDAYLTWTTSLTLQAAIWIAAVAYVVGARDLRLGPRSDSWGAGIAAATFVVLLFLPTAVIHGLADQAPQGLLLVPVNLIAGPIALAFVVWGTLRVHTIAARALAQDPGVVTVASYAHSVDSFDHGPAVVPTAPLRLVPGLSDAARAAVDTECCRMRARCRFVARHVHQ